MLVKLIRIEETQDYILGHLIIDNVIFCHTMERPYKGNQKNVSAIPDGIYCCERVNSPKYGNTFEVKDVPCRSNILFHLGNIADDSRGCILLGERIGYLDRKRAILDSITAVKRFLDRTKTCKSFALKVETVSI